MPTITFDKLSKDKKVLIEKAAIKEFSNYTYDDVSINRIIQDINMPRGSFYLYFENKEDLYLYIISKYITKYIEEFALFIKNNDGDIILSYEYVLDRVLNYCVNGKDAMLITKFLCGLTHRIGSKVPALNSVETINKVINSINITYLRRGGSENLFFILDLLTNTLVHSLTEYLIMNVDIDKVRKKYYEQLEIIRRGIYN